MVLVCEVLTNEPEGGSAMIPVDVFVNLYQFLARLDCGPETCEEAISSEHIESSITSDSTNASLYSEIKGNYLTNTFSLKAVILTKVIASLLLLSEYNEELYKKYT